MSSAFLRGNSRVSFTEGASASGGCRLPGAFPWAWARPGKNASATASSKSRTVFIFISLEIIKEKERSEIRALDIERSCRNCRGSLAARNARHSSTIRTG